jgi:serine/threonine-protein kinase
VRVYDVGEDAGLPFIAMEYVDGETLAELVARVGPLPPEEAARLGIQACRALAAAHAAGLVHRDVKPQNLLLRRDGTLKLGDFGVAFGLEGTRLTMAGTVLGTAAYLAPEQARGEDVTAAADVYGLGAVLYELVTGRPPRTPTTLSELSTAPAIPPPDGAPPAFARLVMHCLSADPARRPASAAEVARVLAGLLPEAQTLPLPDHPSLRATEIKAPRTHRRGKLRPAVALAAIAVGAIAGGVIAAVATSGGGSPKSQPTQTVVTEVPHDANAQQEAQDLAAWLRRYSG